MATATPKPMVLDGHEHREMTDAEYAQWQADKAEAEARSEAQVAKQVAREALLTRLGITADEAQLLLGA
jgi:adenylylsulfate kinase-like enzyme